MDKEFLKSNQRGVEEGFPDSGRASRACRVDRQVGRQECICAGPGGGKGGRRGGGSGVKLMKERGLLWLMVLERQGLGPSSGRASAWYRGSLGKRQEAPQVEPPFTTTRIQWELHPDNPP